MTASLTKVLSWLMEHCLKYELEELRGELANSFPSIVPGQMSSAILPDFDNLILLSLLRKLSNGDTMQITNLKDLDSVIAQFQDQRIENNFPQFEKNSSKNKALLFKFQNLLAQLKNLLDLKERLDGVQFNFNSKVFTDEEMEENSPDKKKIKRQRLIELQEIEREAINMDFLQKKIDGVTTSISKSPLINIFKEYLMKNVLNPSTALELFIRSIENLQGKDSEMTEKEDKLLEKHVQKWPKNIMKDKVLLEKKLIQYVKELAKAVQPKKPKWCPVIFVENPGKYFLIRTL